VTREKEPLWQPLTPAPLPTTRAQAVLYEEGSHVVSSGALATLSGAKTGRSPRDKRIVREPDSEADIWWREGDNGSPNYDMDERCDGACV
jgi:phosphoenolpyruvate carboxykinase (ATP)